MSQAWPRTIRATSYPADWNLYPVGLMVDQVLVTLDEEVAGRVTLSLASSDEGLASIGYGIEVDLEPAGANRLAKLLATAAATVLSKDRSRVGTCQKIGTRGGRRASELSLPARGLEMI